MQPIFPVLGVVKNRINIFYKAMIFFWKVGLEAAIL